MTDVHQELAKLREENEYLKAEIEYFKTSVDLEVENLKAHFKISSQKARILQCVARQNGRVASFDILIAAARTNADNDNGLVKVQVFHMRKQIAPVHIETVWGVGLRLTGEHLETVKSIMAGSRS